MGNCIHCGKSAGLFRSKHEDCAKKYEEGKDWVLATITEFSASSKLDLLPSRINELCENAYIPNSEKNELLVKGWTSVVDGFLNDSVLDEAEEKQLLELQNSLSLSREELDKEGAYSRIAKAAVLRDLLNGVIPQRIKIEGSLPINFQKNEKIVWAFPNVDYLEDKTRRHYEGGSQGVSVRIMKGVYYRVGAFKGHAVNRTERVHADTGWLVITDKHIYFAGRLKSMRVTYSKVISFQPFSDGFGLIRDAANAKSQIFVTGDGWFAYNLVTNLAQF